MGCGESVMSTAQSARSVEMDGVGVGLWAGKGPVPCQCSCFSHHWGLSMFPP